MDVEEAARESFRTGRPCTFVRESQPAGQPFEVTVHPDGRVETRRLRTDEDGRAPRA